MPQPELLVSPPGTGKTAHCVDLFRAEILRTRAGIDSRSYFVLPNREHAERIQNLLIKKGVAGLFNAHVLTLNDLAARFTDGSDAPSPAESVRVAAVRSLLSEESEAGNLSYFGRVADAKGFARALSSFFAEMRRGLATVADFETWCQPLLASDPVFRLKFRDLSILVKRYEEAIRSRGYSEPEERMTRLESASPAADLVLFDGFYRFTPAQLALVAAFARGARRTVVTLTAADDAESRPDTFAHVLRTRRELEALGFRPVRPPKGVSRRPIVPEIIEAPNAREEMRAVAREIRRLYRTGPLHWSDFAVILRTVESYRKVLESAFAEFGVPVHIHERRRLIEQGLAQTVVRFLKLLRDDWKEADAAFVVHSSCWHSESGAMDDALELVRAARAAGIRDGRPVWEKFASDSQAPPEARQRLAHLLEEEGRIRTARSRAELSRRLHAWLQALDTSGDKLVYSAIEEVLERFGRGEEKEGSFSSVRGAEELIDALEAGLYSEKPRGRNRVQVYDVIMALPKEYRTVFVSGLAEKAFPKETNEEPVLKDIERRAINELAGRTVFEERVSRLAGERYFFYIAATRARERLTLTYPAAGLDGRPVLPSIFIEDMRNEHPGLQARRTAVESGSAFWEGEREALIGSAGEEFRRTGPRELRAVLQDASNRRYLSALDRAFSPSSLEALVACRFRYFSSKLLKLEAMPEDRSAAEQGMVFHKTLETFFQSLSEQERADAARWADPRALAARLYPFLEKAFADNAYFRRIPAHSRTVLQARMRRALARFAREESDLRRRRPFIPGHFEKEFGVTKPLEIGGLAVRGIIDRIDVSPDGKTAIVIDYKSSKTNFVRRIARGLELQMPIYWMAVEKMLGVRVAGVEHRHLKDGQAPERRGRQEFEEWFGKSVWSEAEIEAVMKRTREDAASAVKALRSADIAVDSKSCDHCDYSALCRFEKWKLIYREDV